MHPRFRSLSPRLNWILLLVIAFSLCSVPSYAMPPPELVTEDTLVLGVPVASVELDSTHFAEMSLLVGTDTNTSGTSYALRVGVGPLRVLDTLFKFDRQVTQVRAGHLDENLELDYLVSVDSNLAVIVNGSSVDSLIWSLGAPIQDVAIDEASNRFWIAYHQEVSEILDWPPGEDLFLGGGLLQFDSLADSGQNLLESKAATDIRVFDLDAPGDPRILVTWLNETAHLELCHHSFQCPSCSWSGMLLFDSSGILLRADTLLDAYAGLTSRYADRAATRIAGPIPLADLDGDGDLDYVVSGWHWSEGTIAAPLLAVYDAVTGEAVWSTTEGGWDRPILWYLDDDSLLDVFVHTQYSGTDGFRGTTGERLFHTPDPKSMAHVVAGELDELPGREGVASIGDTLFTFRLVWPSAVEDETINPRTFTLYPNCPNPFNASTEIEYSLDTPGKVRLGVFNLLGQHVCTLVDESLPAGRHSVSWNGTDEDGVAVASGVYFYRLALGDEARSQKMMLLK